LVAHERLHCVARKGAFHGALAGGAEGAAGVGEAADLGEWQVFQEADDEAGVEAVARAGGVNGLDGVGGDVELLIRGEDGTAAGTALEGDDLWAAVQEGTASVLWTLDTGEEFGFGAAGEDDVGGIHDGAADAAEGFFPSE